jgi:4-amino-4-deoxy-L-arabinose transferase-like glycosyltransferase
MDKNPNSWQALLPEIVLLALLAILFLWNANSFEIDPYSEIFHLAAAKQTAYAGHFWIPSINGHDYLIRAPFWTWIITLLFKIFGSSLWLARIPAILCALGGIALTFFLTMELTASRMAGLFAASILGTTWGYFHLGTLSTADILASDLYLGYFLALVKWHNIATRRSPLPVELNTFSSAFGVIIGLLLLVKGGFSTSLLILIGLVYLFFHQDLFLISRLNLKLIVGLIAAFLIPWLILGSVATKSAMFPVHYLVVEPFQRMFASGPWKGLQWDPFFYLKRLPGDLLPYLLFIPAAFMECIMPRRTATSFQMQTEPWLIWLSVWFLLGLTAYSFCAFQEPSLMLPFYPAAAILVGHYLGRASESVSGSNLYNNTVSVYILALMAVAVLCSVIIFQVIPSDYVKGFWHLPGQPVIEFLQIKDHRIDLQEPFPLWKFWMIPGPFILLLGGLTLYVLQLLRRNTAGAFAILSTSLLFLLFVKMIYLPILHRPVPQLFAQQISKKVGKKDTVVLYSLHPDIKRVLFYLDDRKVADARVVRNDAEFQKALNSSAGTVYGVIREKSFFNDIDYSYRNLLRVNQFNWKWDMTRLAELRKLLAVRQPMFNKMKSEMLSFQSVPSSSIRDLQAEMGLDLAPMGSTRIQSAGPIDKALSP